VETLRRLTMHDDELVGPCTSIDQKHLSPEA